MQPGTYAVGVSTSVGYWTADETVEVREGEGVTGIRLVGAPESDQSDETDDDEDDDTDDDDQADDTDEPDDADDRTER